MTRRLPFYFVLVAAVALIGVIGYKMVGRWNTCHHFTELDWLQMANIPIVVAGVFIAAHKLRSNELSEPNKPIRTMVVEGADSLKIGFRRRPLLALIVIALLPAIPFALVTLVRGTSYGTWTRTDWASLAVVEAPILLIFVVAIARSFKRPPNNRLEQRDAASSRDRRVE
jgi:hypothetical protein